MTRRESVAAALAFAALALPRGAGLSTGVDAIEWLRSRVPPDLAREVAGDLARQAPSDAEPQALAAYARRLAPHTEAGQARMRRDIRADFEAGRVMLVAGWMAARTEARLIAAAA